MQLHLSISIPAADRDMLNLQQTGSFRLLQKEVSKSSEQAQVSSVHGIFTPRGFNC